MTARRPRSALLATVLALLAVFGMSALSGWHGATFHDDDPVHAASVRHVHDDGARGDPDSAVHLGAHAIGHGIAIPLAARPFLRLPRLKMAWTAGAAVIREGLDPASLLRPPRG